MKKLLIVSQHQFGYHIDAYMYSKYLKNKFAITFICWDYNKNKIILENINIIYISRKGNIILRNFRFIYKTIFIIKKINFNTIFIDYFRGSFFLKIFAPKNNYILDIRTGSVANTFLRRFVYNKILLFETLFFNKVTIISKSLRKYLGINKNKVKILPLGSDEISTTNKNFDDIKLLYVGTFNNRKLEKTINGFYKFYNENKYKFNIKYTIIGSGKKNEEEKIKEMINKFNLNKVINLLGYIQHDKLKPYFDEHNIGIVFVPQEKKYEYQPPTKLFEYLMSGMPVIATKTFENKKIINKNNGILIDDTDDGFYMGLKSFILHKANFNSKIIKKSVSNYTWKRIIFTYLFPILNNESIKAP